MKPGDVVVSVVNGRERMVKNIGAKYCALKDKYSIVYVAKNPVTGLPTGYALKEEEKGR